MFAFGATSVVGVSAKMVGEVLGAHPPKKATCKIKDRPAVLIAEVRPDAVNSISKILT